MVGKILARGRGARSGRRFLRHGGSPAAEKPAPEEAVFEMRELSGLLGSWATTCEGHTPTRDNLPRAPPSRTRRSSVSQAEVQASRCTARSCSIRCSRRQRDRVPFRARRVGRGPPRGEEGGKKAAHAEAGDVALESLIATVFGCAPTTSRPLSLRERSQAVALRPAVLRPQSRSRPDQRPGPEADEDPPWQALPPWTG